jgi:hypothetical protein
MYRQLQSKSKVLVDKARSKGFWHELVQDGMDEESKNQRDNSKTPEWWEKIDIKRKEKKYGKRVDMLQRLGCRLLRTSSFLEVLSVFLAIDSVPRQQCDQTFKGCCKNATD